MDSASGQVADKGTAEGDGFVEDAEAALKMVWSYANDALSWDDEVKTEGGSRGSSSVASPLASSSATAAHSPSVAACRASRMSQPALFSFKPSLRASSCICCSCMRAREVGAVSACNETESRTLELSRGGTASGNEMVG